MKKTVLVDCYDKALLALTPKERKILQKYKSRFSFCAAGSLGRGEVVLSSDIDYLVLVDREGFSAEEYEDLRSAIASQCMLMDTLMDEEYFIRPDAGLANLSRQPIVTDQDIMDLQIRLGASRQTVEPSEIFDIDPIHSKRSARKTAQKLQGMLVDHLLQTQQLETLQEFFVGDWRKYYDQFIAGLGQLQNADIVVDTKLQFVRATQFFIMYLWSQALPELSPTEQGTSSTVDKLKLLAHKGFLTYEEASSLDRLIVSLYKHRYRGDVFGSAYSQQEDRLDLDKKRKIVARLDPNLLPPQERQGLINTVQTAVRVMQERMPQDVMTT